MLDLKKIVFIQNPVSLKLSSAINQEQVQFLYTFVLSRHVSFFYSFIVPFICLTFLINIHLYNDSVSILVEMYHKLQPKYTTRKYIIFKTYLMSV